LIEGYDVHPALKQMYFTFVNRNASWLIADDTDLEDLGQFSDRQIWEFGEVLFKKSPHFIIFYHPDQARYAGALLAGAEEALPLVDQAYQGSWGRQIVLEAPSDAKELSRLLQSTVDIDNFVAFAFSSIDRHGPEAWELGGHRVMLNRANYLKYSADGRRRVLAHELTHVATRESTGPFVPTFVEEGLAQLTGLPATSLLNSRIKNHLETPRLPQDWEFAAGGSDDILTAYQQALSAVTYMKDHFGLDKLSRFYGSLGQQRVVAGTAKYHLDQSMRQVFGVSLDDFVKAWAADATKRAG